MKYITIFLLFIAQFSFAQSKSLDKVIDRIDYQTDTIQAVYDWVTNNVKYDVAKLKKLERGENFYQKGKYKSTEEYKAAMLENVIKRKKGVCEDYSLLFDAVVRELGYTSQIIEGITKDKKGKIRSSIGHSWNAVNINGQWKLFDTTWGAGYVKDGKKFEKRYNAKWYDVKAEEMRNSHFPFDPIWQLSSDPMTYKEFKNGSQDIGSDEPYPYNEMIATHLSKGEKEKIIDALNRSESNGGNIKPIKKHRKYLKMKISVTDIPSTLDACRASAELFNEYFNEGRNKRFQGEKWTMEYSKNNLLDIKEQLEQSIVAFKNVKLKDSKSNRTFKKNITQSKKILKRLDKELKFLDAEMK